MSIRLEHVSYAYEDNSSKKNNALKDINLEINQRLEQYISMMKIYIQKDTHYENYVEK